MGQWYEVTDWKTYDTLVPTTSYFVACMKCGEEFQTWSLSEAAKNNPTCPACGYAGKEAGE